MTPYNSKVAGTLLLVGGIQFVIALILAEAVYPSYSIAHNYISDLGVWGKPSAAIFNLSVMIFGISIIINPVWYSWKYGGYFDLSGYNTPFGGFCIILGMLFIWSEIRKRMRNRTGREEEEKGVRKEKERGIL
jgi:hypothetical membrane protein